MERASDSFCRALVMLCSGVELRPVAEAFRGSGEIDYAGLAADDFEAAYSLMREALTPA